MLEEQIARMRIVHWAKYYPPEWGGTEGVTYDLAVGASESGHDVDVVAFTRHADACQDDRGVRVLRARVSAYIDTQPLSVRWMREALRAAREADVLHIHAPNLIAAMILPFVPRRVATAIHWHTDLVNKGLLGRLARPLELIMAWRADRLLASSQLYADASDVMRRFRKKTVAIPLGIEDPVTAPCAPAPPPAIASFSAGRPMVLAVGRAVPYKGFEYLIRAAAQMRVDGAVVIVGTGPLEAEYRQLIAELGVSNRVMLAGRLSSEDLKSLFHAADVYVMSSAMRSEAFGIVLLEAMAHSLPIVATAIKSSGVPWVAGDGETGPIVPPRDPGAMARAIDELLTDPQKRADFALRSRARYERHFTRQKMLDAVLALYREIIGARQ